MSSPPPQPAANRAQRRPRRDLNAIHIYLIAISGTIGMGVFGDSGLILSTAGPGGCLLAFGVVGIFVFCIMDGVAEMISHWPISNAMFEFVRAFVDEELSFVMTFAYWFAQSSNYASLILAAANLANKWTWGSPVHVWAYIVGGFVGTLSINVLKVKVYGNFEAVLGAVKMALVVGVFITLIIITHRGKYRPALDVPPGASSYKYISEGFKANHDVTTSWALAMFSCIPIATYAYFGVEIVAVTAVEAKNPVISLKRPARYIALITWIGYFLSVMMFSFTVSWMDPQLSSHSRPVVGHSTPSGTPPVIIAYDHAGGRWSSIGSNVINGVLIIAVLSTANTALYVASRTLWGLACRYENRLWPWARRITTLTSNALVPVWAVVISAFSFSWMFFPAEFAPGQNWQVIMSGIATVGVVLVWASQCLAFIRYRSWLQHLPSSEELSEFDHTQRSVQPNPHEGLFGYLQPPLAWCGLIFCGAVVFIFPMALWWNKQWLHHGSPAIDVATAFAAPIFLFILWLVLKLRRKVFSEAGFEWCVPEQRWTGHGIRGLRDIIQDLNEAIHIQEPSTTIQWNESDVAIPVRQITGHLGSKESIGTGANIRRW